MTVRMNDVHQLLHENDVILGGNQKKMFSIWIAKLDLYCQIPWETWNISLRNSNVMFM